MDAKLEQIVDLLLQRGDTPKAVAAALGLRDRMLTHRPGRRRHAPFGQHGRKADEN